MFILGISLVVEILAVLVKQIVLSSYRHLFFDRFLHNGSVLLLGHRQLFAELRLLLPPERLSVMLLATDGVGRHNDAALSTFLSHY